MQEDDVIYEAFEIIEESDVGIIDIEMSEAFQAPASTDTLNHAMLTSREIRDQHPITAITGLREELDSIEALQTIYSDKKGNADYYEWADGLVFDENIIGHFVSLNRDVTKISICTGDDIFGVVVDDAAFVGGQNDIKRDNHYGLVSTSGMVNVRCELDVNEGDYVLANEYGRAARSTSGCGYKVVALNTVNGVLYATINLNIAADQANMIGTELNLLKNRMQAAESDIITAVNTANKAQQQSLESNNESGRALQQALDALGMAQGAERAVSNMGDILTTVAANVEQAKDIANSADTFAQSIRSEAIAKANEAWAKADEVATESYTLCAKIDKYSVGEYSQAYGLTFEQAQIILEPGMIYAPTKHIGAAYHTETYPYTHMPEEWVESERDEKKVYYNSDDKEYWYYQDGWKSSQDMPTYERIFTEEYLYEWGYLPAIQKYGWITIDKFHRLINYESAVEINLADKAVFFSSKEPNIAVGSDFGYWYTYGDTIEDKSGAPGKFEPRTLYKWNTDHWVAVATLAGNVSNRATSYIQQTVNSIDFEVTNTRGSVATLGARLSETDAKVQTTAQWSKGTDKSGQPLYNIATIDQSADGDGSSLALVVTDTTEGGENKVLSGASIVLNNEDGGSSIYFDADRINFETCDFTIDANHINFEADDFIIDASKINMNGAVTFGDLSSDLKLNAMSSCIISSAGSVFDANNTGTTTLTAYIYEGTSIAANSENFEYTWWISNPSGDDIELKDEGGNQLTGRVITVSTTSIVGKSIYFKADDKDVNTQNSVLNLARLGFMVLGVN